VNVVFTAIVLAAFVVAAFRQAVWDGAGTAPMEALSAAMIESAQGAVTLAIGLVGAMALFLGLMKVAEAGGLLTIVAKLLRPLLVRLFPEVPANHPAMGAVIFNLSANVLGLGNAATPFGIRAMQELDRINLHKGTASNAMVLFLAINTSSVTILPTGVIAVRAAAGSADPAGIVATTLFATICSTTVAIIAAKSLSRFFPMGPKPAPVAEQAPEAEPEALPEDPGAYPTWVSFAALAGILSLVPLTILWGKAIAPWIVPGLMVALLGFGALRGVKVYEMFVEGARDGFQVAIRIIPYLVAILVAVAMLRVSGGLDLLVQPLGLLTAPFGLPAEALPMALLRPLSGSGAYGIMVSILGEFGPDSYVGYLVSTMQGSTETTFYVLAVYFGAVGIRRIRHALAAGLIADVTGVVSAVAIVSWLYG